MEANINELLDKILSQLQKEVKTETIIGAEFQLGEYKVVPVMKVGMAFGGAGGSGNGHLNKQGGSGVGAGAGLGIKPIGFLVTKGDEIKMLPAGGSKGLAMMFEKMPDLMEKAIELKFGPANTGEKKEEEE